MIDLGLYKTSDSKTFRCHYNSKTKSAIAMGPLPELAVPFLIEADTEQAAAEKLAEVIGRGVFTASCSSDGCGRR